MVNNHNTTDTAVKLHFNSKAPVRASKAVRTSATESWATVAKPSVKGGTASATLPARSITTYVLDQKATALRRSRARSRASSPASA